MNPVHEGHRGIVSGEERRRYRILHVVYSFMIGGSEQLVLTLVRAMPSFLHGVVAVDLDGPLELEFRQAGASTWQLDRLKTGRFRAAAELRRVVREFAPDVIHSHHLHELIYALPAGIGSGARLIHTEHEYYSLRAPKPRFALRALATRCNAVTGVDEETVAYLRESVGIPARKLALVRNGISVEKFRRVGADRASFGLSKTDLVLGVIARLELVKGHDVLLAAFALVQQQFPAARLLVVGEGARRDHLEKLARELGIDANTIWLGSRRDIPEILSILDVFTLCSMEEGLPMSLLEAMAAAKPVVATAVGGIPKLLRDGTNGLLIPPGDVDAAASAFRRLLGDPDLRTALGVAGSKTVEDTYSLSQTVARYQDLYNDRPKPDRL